MKNEKQHRHLLSTRSVLALMLVSTTFGLFFSACQKKLDHQFAATDGILRFVVTDTIQWQAGQTAQSTSQLATTSTAPATAKVEGTLEEGRQMYLRASVTNGIKLGSSAQQDVVTRGTMMTKDNFHSTFGIYAMTYTGQAGNFTPNFLNNVQATGSVTSGYSTTPKYYVPTGKNVKIFAYAPYFNTASANGLSQPTFTGARPSYSFTTPDYIDQQIDLCFAETTATSSNSTANVNFEHAMAAIRLIIGSDVPNCHVNSITLSQIGSTATVTPIGGQGGWWGSTTATKDFTYNRGGSGVDHTTGKTTDLFEAGKAMFMIPQTLGQQAVITINVTDTKTQKVHTLSASLASQQWTKGMTYTYTLSFNLVGDVNINIDNVDVSTVPATGGEFQLTVTSERDGTYVPYVVQYQQSNGTWATLNTTDFSTMISGQRETGSGTTRTLYLNTDEEYTIENKYKEMLQRGQTGGTQENPTNLAKGPDGKDAQENSANCYIVSGPGWYQIPIAYGNAIKNGGPNNLVIGKYQSAYGTTINDQWIKTTASPDYQKVLWQDVPGLVRNVQLHGTESKYLKFYVDPTTIEEGNAVIGVFNDNPIKLLWSWHIWVTTETDPIYMQRNTNFGNGIAMMDRPVGYVHGGLAEWKAESLTIRVVPKDPDNPTDTNGNDNLLLDKATASVTINKEGATQDTPGRYPTYQWGRKDPMRPIAMSPTGGTTDAQVYPSPGGDETYLPKNATFNSASQSEWIQNPHKYHISTESILPYLWNANLNSSSITSIVSSSVKALNNPCPAGYKVPTAGSFDELIMETYSYGNYYLITNVPSPNLGTGGYAKGLSAFDLINKNYGTEQDGDAGAGYGYGFAKFWVYSISNTTANGRVIWRLPLLGGRAHSDGYTAKRYGTNGFYWMSGKPSATTGYCCALYIAQSGTPWIDVMGVAPQNTADTPEGYASFLVGDLRNAFAIIPQKE